jgi:hypothetical protein
MENQWSFFKSFWITRSIKLFVHAIRNNWWKVELKLRIRADFFIFNWLPFQTPIKYNTI